MGKRPPAPDTLEGCPKRDEHTPSPEGYLAWHAWAERKSRTHRQIKHQPCGLFAVWVPRAARLSATPPAQDREEDQKP